MTGWQGSCLVLGAAALFGAAAAAPAAPALHQPEEEQHARPRLVAERTALVPGAENWVGVTFEIDPGWHLYWNGLNDTGMPPSVSWKLPEGYAAGEILWPAPVRHVSPGDLLDHIYEERVTLLVPIKVPADAQPGAKVTLAADLEWLVCKQACIPGWQEVTLTLPVAQPGQQPAFGKDRPLLEEARRRLPKPIDPSDKNIAVRWQDGSVHVNVKGAKALAFFPEEGSVRLARPIEGAEAKSGELRLEFEPPEEPPARLVGVLQVTTDDPKQPRFFRIDARPPADSAAQGG